MTTKTMTPKTTLVKCPCPRCYLGYHDQPELAEKYRRVGELERELAATQAALEQMTRDAMTTAKDRDEWMWRAMRYSQALACI